MELKRLEIVDKIHSHGFDDVPDKDSQRPAFFSACVRVRGLFWHGWIERGISGSHAETIVLLGIPSQCPGRQRAPVPGP